MYTMFQDLKKEKGELLQITEVNPNNHKCMCVCMVKELDPWFNQVLCSKYVEIWRVSWM